MLILHPTTALLLQPFRRRLPQSFLLYGEKGVGLQSIALKLAARNLQEVIRPENNKGEPSGEGTIGVEVIRKLYNTTRAKQTHPVVIIIDNADRMTHGAQNAFLKLLEEPNPFIHFILTTHQHTSLLPTVRSRVQHLHVQRISSTQSTELISALHITDSIKQTQLLFLAQGLPAEITRLARDPDYFASRAAIINNARTLIAATPYQKLKLIQQYKSDRDSALHLLDSTLHILQRSLSADPQPKLIVQLEKFLIARELIAGNQSVALQLARAVL